jgi:hypothetical protein
MIPAQLWPLIASFCHRAERTWLGYGYDASIALHMAPCKLLLPATFLQPLYNALFVRARLDNEVFMYDANAGRTLYFGMYDRENYEFAVTTKTALTTPACGEWIVWSGAEERVTLVRNGTPNTQSTVVKKSYCFELQQWPNVVLWSDSAIKADVYWANIKNKHPTRRARLHVI